MLFGPCLAAMTAPAAAPDMMEFQGSWGLWWFSGIQRVLMILKVTFSCLVCIVPPCPWCEQMCSQRRRSRFPRQQTDLPARGPWIRYFRILASWAPTSLSPWWCLPSVSSGNQLEHCRHHPACWRNHHLGKCSQSKIGFVVVTLYNMCV